MTKVFDDADAHSWDEQLHQEGHSASGTSASDCNDADCQYRGRNRPLADGVPLQVPADKIARIDTGGFRWGSIPESKHEVNT